MKHLVVFVVSLLVTASALACELAQSTTATIKLGPFVDSTDGVTAETALTISQADVRLSKNGGDIAQKNESTAAAHDELGYYDVPINATDTNTLGRLQIMVSESGALPVWMNCNVLTLYAWEQKYLLNYRATGTLGGATTASLLDVGTTVVTADDQLNGDAVWLPTTNERTYVVDTFNGSPDTLSVSPPLRTTPSSSQPWRSMPNDGPYVAFELPALDGAGNAYGNNVLIEDADATDVLGAPQTGDSFARLGAPAGASVSADIAALPTNAEFELRTPSAAQLAQLLEDVCLNRSILVNDSDFDDSGQDSAEFMNRAGDAVVVTVLYQGTNGTDREVTLGACN
jgi:hypothetical protein